MHIRGQENISYLHGYLVREIPNLIESSAQHYQVHHTYQPGTVVVVGMKTENFQTGEMVKRCDLFMVGDDAKQICTIDVLTQQDFCCCAFQNYGADTDDRTLIHLERSVFGVNLVVVISADNREFFKDCSSKNRNRVGEEQDTAKSSTTPKSQRQRPDKSVRIRENYAYHAKSYQTLTIGRRWGWRNRKRSSKACIWESRCMTRRLDMGLKGLRESAFI